MPNWCEGTLKVRGTVNQLRNFILDGLESVTWLGDTTDVVKPSWDDDTQFEVSVIEHALWLKGSRRHFLEPEYIDIYSDDPEDKVVWATPLKVAWSIDSECLVAASKKYGVDFKIQAFERGMQFSQLIEVVDGELLKDEEITYEDWDWDCPCPLIGG